jgi:hypothetical protein
MNIPNPILTPDITPLLATTSGGCCEVSGGRATATEELNGRPQFGQAGAMSDTCRPQSGQLISGTVTPCKFRVENGPIVLLWLECVQLKFLPFSCAIVGRILYLVGRRSIGITLSNSRAICINVLCSALGVLPNVNFGTYKYTTGCSERS